MNIKGFIKSEKVGEILNTGYLSGENVVLWGPGGYGKSEMSLKFLSQIGARNDQITVKSLSVGTSVDDLYGGIDIRALQKDNKLVYNVDNSIFSTPYLILEEAFDAPLRVLESLKDVLTSGYIRNGHQQYKIKTKFIIVCTNRDKQDIIEDASSEALMQRFPLSLQVNWRHHRLNDYTSLVKTVFGNVPREIEYLLDFIVKSLKQDTAQSYPSPRTIVKMVKIFNASGVTGLKYLDIPNIERAINDFKVNYAKMIEEEKAKAKQKELDNANHSQTLFDRIVKDLANVKKSSNLNDSKIIDFKNKVNALDVFGNDVDTKIIKKHQKTLLENI